MNQLVLIKANGKQDISGEIKHHSFSKLAERLVSFVE